MPLLLRSILAVKNLAIAAWFYTRASIKDFYIFANCSRSADMILAAVIGALGSFCISEGNIRLTQRSITERA